MEATRTKGIGYLSTADALSFLRALRPEIADVVFLDPPFNLGKHYGIAAWLEEGDRDCYEFYMRQVIREAGRVLKRGGSLFLYHLPYWATKLSDELQKQLDFRHWIAVAMKNGFVRGKHLYPAHYALLYYTKGDPAHFFRMRLKPQLCRHCGEFVKDYGGYTNIIRMKGINLSDFWEDLSPVRHKGKKHRKENQLPLTLTDRVVAISGFKGGLLVDPFAGTGTCLVSAMKAGMIFLGNDLSSRSAKICLSRLDTT
jgi:site-specific DNA-methyltransferase (adenine-specific)